MWKRLLLALDGHEAGQAALDHTSAVAHALGSSVEVLHVIELGPRARPTPLETEDDARSLVGAAIDVLHERGVAASGRITIARSERLAIVIATEAEALHCDAIVLGSRRLRGFGRLSAQRVREGVVRLTPLPVLVAPSSLSDQLRRVRRLKVR